MKRYSIFFLGNCLTVAGGNVGMKCIFPFILEGVTHDACTTHTNEDPEWLPWCSTKVDKFGVHVSGGDHWGDCGPECQLESGDHINLFALIAITVYMQSWEYFQQ